MGKNESTDKKCSFHKFKTLESKTKIIRHIKNNTTLTWIRYLLDLNQLTVSLAVKEKNRFKEQRQRCCVFDTSHWELPNIFIFPLQDGTSPNHT